MTKIVNLPISEMQLHKIVAEWLEIALTPETFWSTFPSGGGGVVRGANLRTMGLKSGVPDLMIVHRSEAYFIELKTAKGVLSAAQVECHEQLLEAGARIVVCRSLRDVANSLKAWNIPSLVFKD